MVYFLILLLIIVGWGESRILNFLSLWKYQKKIDITNPSLNPIDNEDVFFLIDTSTLIENDKLDENCEEIYISNKYMDKPYDFWIEIGCNTKYTKIWLNTLFIPSDSFREIFFFYGYQGNESFFESEYKSHNKKFNGVFLQMSSSTDQCPMGSVKKVGLEERFIIGAKNESEYGIIGGNVNLYKTIHNHNPFTIRTVSYCSTAYYIFDWGYSGPYYLSYNHLHYDMETTLSDNTTIPPYYDMVFCESNQLIVEKNMVMMFQDDDFSADGISLGNGLVDRYPRINSIAGNTGGSYYHGHCFPTTKTGGKRDTGSRPQAAGSNHRTSPEEHDHEIIGDCVYLRNDLSYFTVIFGVIDTDNPNGEIFEKPKILLADSVPPFGYKILEQSKDRYLKGSENQYLYIEDLSVNDQHRHTYSKRSSGYSGPDAAIKGSNNDNCAVDHDHVVYGDTGYTDNQTPYFKALFITSLEKNEYDVDEEEELLGNENEDKEKPDLKWVYIVGTSVSVSLCLIIFVLCFSVILYCRKNKKSSNKFKELKEFNIDVDILLEESKASQGNPKLKINSKLFEIKHEEVKLVSHIGVGGSGCQIYKAKWNNRDVAYKVFRTNLFASTDDYQDFEKEINILSSISHPSVLQFYGAVIKPPRLGIVFEFCSYGTLRSYCEINSVVFDEKIRMTKQICSGMKYIHSRNIIHRDLKGDNVLITSSVDCKIIDFGLSKFLEENSKLTKRIGTSGILAPEMFSSSKYTNKVDVFSFGILLFEIMENNFNPYGNTPSVDAKVCNDPTFRPKFTKKDQLPKYIVQIIETSWSHNPKERMNFAKIMKILEKHNPENLNSQKKGIDNYMITPKEEEKVVEEENFDQELKNLQRELGKSKKIFENALKENKKLNKILKGKTFHK